MDKIKKFACILGLAAIISMMAGCRELPLIGELAGQWQVSEIVYPDGTTVTAPERYYCFYRHTAHLTCYANIRHTANMTYDYPDLALEFPNVSPCQLTSWGVFAPPEANDETRGWIQRYTIDRLTDSQLIMTTAEGTRITLRKY